MPQDVAIQIPSNTEEITGDRMTIRNTLLAQILEAYEGTPAEFDSRNTLLEKILIANGGAATNPTIRNFLLVDIVEQLGGTVTNPSIRNSLLRDIVLAVGGPITNPNNRNQLLLDWLANAGPLFARQWTIGNLGDDYGYHQTNTYGALVPNDWFNFVDTVDVLIVDDSANAAILQSTVSSMWGLSNAVTLNVEGFGDIILTWNGATAYINVGDTAFVAYIMGQVGNSIGLNILPKNSASPTSRRIITTLLEFESTTLNDIIIHTGS